MNGRRLEAGTTLDEETGAALAAEAQAMNVAKGDRLIVDLSATETMDTRGGAWLLEIADYVRDRRGEFAWEGQRGPVAEQLALIEPALQPGARAQIRQTGFVERTGAATIAAAKEFREFFELLIDAVYWTILGPLTGAGRMDQHPAATIGRPADADVATRAGRLASSWFALGQRGWGSWGQVSKLEVELPL